MNDLSRVKSLYRNVLKAPCTSYLQSRSLHLATYSSRFRHLNCNPNVYVLKQRFQYSPYNSRLYRNSAINEPESGSSHRTINIVRRLVVIFILTTLGSASYVLFLRHIEKVPETGRWRMMDIKPEIEAQLGQESYTSLVSKYRLHLLRDNDPIAQHIHNITNAILKANGLGRTAPALTVDGQMANANLDENTKWSLAVIDGDGIINSTASLGGIVVFTGILSVCKNDDELASVLAHEISHVVARHLAERYTKIKNWSLLQLLGLRNSSPAEYQKFMATNLHIQELEADSIGLRLSTSACFDPNAAIRVQERLDRLERRLQQTHPEYNPTHPHSDERIKRMKDLLPELLRLQSSNSRCSSALSDLQKFRHESSSHQ